MKCMKDFSKEIKAYALKNALEFGKADAGRILPKLFQHGLEKKDIKKVMPEIVTLVKEVNALATNAVAAEEKKYEQYVAVHEHTEGELPELEHAVRGKVVTRLSPEPSKYMHIGHALIFMIQYLYAKKYKGKCLLRFDDTNPEKSTAEFYDAIKEDVSWLGIQWDKELLASDDLPRLYQYAEKLIKEENAFVCSCSQEEMKKLREKMKSCTCRKNSVKEHLKEWNEMLQGKFEEGERTLRLKGDMKSSNGVMRDPVIFRIAKHEHFRQGKKYSVWPMYDFEAPLEDSLEGVTHLIRSNEFELRAELHEHLLTLLNLKIPFIREIGRYQIAGAETQGRIIRELIEKKEIKGWDDPRLVTIRALRRRGFVPEMFHELAKIVGLSKNSGHIDPSVLASVNRKIIDAQAERYYFVAHPHELAIVNAPRIQEVALPVHPDKQEKRKVKVSRIFISGDDVRKLKGKEVRLLHLYNIQLGKTNKATFTSAENKDIPKIQWVSEGVKTSILMPDATWTEGLAEASISRLKPGAIVQFERFGFCRFDGIQKKGNEQVYEFWFAHK